MYARLTTGNTRHLRWMLTVLTVTLLLVVLATFPSLATEGGGTEKVGLPTTPHDQVGLIILGGVGLAALAAGVNIWRQLRGERPQADGKIRWR